MIGRQRERGQAGFTLIEVLVVMAIISVLMGFGIGMYQGLSSLGKATQAKNTIIDTIETVKRSSLTSRAELVIDPEANLVYGLESVLVASSNFEPAVNDQDSAPGEVIGLGFKRGRISGKAELKPFPWGHTGGALVSENGAEVNFGNYAEFDFIEGVDLDIWVYPIENRTMDLIMKGDSYGIRLKKGSGGPIVEAFIALAEEDEDLTVGRPARERYEVPRPLVLNRWNRVQLKYDRNVVTIHVDSTGRGAVERLRQKETRRIRPDLEASLTVGSSQYYLVGRVDDMKVAGILSGERRSLPEDVGVLGEARKIHFLDGKLDPTEHRGEVVITIMYKGVEDPITIGMLGNIIGK